MNARTKLLKRAAEDVDQILFWLGERSPEGADRWYRAFLDAADKIAADPAHFGQAAEAARLKNADFREAYFSTPHGGRYRLIFTVMEDATIRIMRVRAPGQRPLRKRDLET